MNNRRFFLLETGMAAAAMVFSSPVKAICGLQLNLPGLKDSGPSILLINSLNQETALDEDEILNSVKSLQVNNQQALLLKVGIAQWTVDSNYHQQCQVIKKGGVYIGLIKVNDETLRDESSFKRLSGLAKKLKTVNRCQLVTCISSLGYRNGHQQDDINIAKRSSYIDVIAGTRPSNFHQSPFIQLNRDQQEIVLHYPASKKDKLACVEIGFDGLGKKNSINFRNYSM